MNEFGWKIADIAAAALLAFFVLFPPVVGDEFLKRLHASHPALWIASLGASIGFIAVTVGHRVIQNRRSKRVKKTHAGPDKSIV
jgi:hypothetical protein